MSTPQPTPRDMDDALRWLTSELFPTTRRPDHTADDLQTSLAHLLAARDAEWRERVETAERQRRIACGVADKLGDKLRAFKEKCAAFLDADGEPRKALGTLPVTADGCFVGHGAKIYHPVIYICNDKDHSIVDGPEFDMVLAEAYVAEQDPQKPPFVCWGGPSHDCAYLSECYSTRSAAEAARKEGV